MPRHLQPTRPGDILRSPLQHLPHPPMQVLPGGPRHRIVRLRANQLVPELEPTMHLAENPLILQPREGLPGSCRSELDYGIQRQVRRAPPPAAPPPPAEAARPRTSATLRYCCRTPAHWALRRYAARSTAP